MSAVLPSGKFLRASMGPWVYECDLDQTNGILAAGGHVHDVFICFAFHLCVFQAFNPNMVCPPVHVPIPCRLDVRSFGPFQ